MMGEGDKVSVNIALKTLAWIHIHVQAKGIAHAFGVLGTYRVVRGNYPTQKEMYITSYCLDQSTQYCGCPLCLNCYGRVSTTAGEQVCGNCMVM